MQQNLRNRSQILILLIALTFCFPKPVWASPSDSTNTKARYDGHMNRLSKDWIYAGAEFARPMLRYGYKSSQPWFGPSFLFMGGLMSASFLRGTAEVNDSGKVYRAKGNLIQLGFQIPFPMMYRRSMEIVPSLGFGFGIHTLDDKRKRGMDPDIEATQFGMFLKPSVLVKMGPLVGTLSYSVGAGINFTKRNAIPVFSHYPSLGLHMSSMPILLNPRDFSASGKRHYKDLVSVERVNSGLTYYKKVEETQDYIKYRKEQIQWVKSTYNHRYEEEVIHVKDVKPFTYIGPRISTSYFVSEQIQAVTNIGANLGFRYGLWWMNAFAETGDILVKSPEKQEQLQFKYNSASFPTLSGTFKNSTKFGGQLGIDLVVRSIKSDFKPHYGQSKETGAATSYTAIIPFVGYGQTNMGSFSYGDNTTMADVEHYESISKNKVFRQESIAKTQVFYNFGLGIHVGAMTFGMDYYVYPKAKILNSRQIYCGLNLPVARIFRAILVKEYQRKLRKEATE
ncbi:MAG TPA: hypothetical protein PLK63_11555 [Catalimonadaceae bacterium]|nr:hypothetical protein [Catalimonadaceae bacterium]